MGYKIYYGTSSNNYTTTVDVGNVLTRTVTGLTCGLTYYFAVTAYDTSGNESNYSGEVSTTISACSGGGGGGSSASGGGGCGWIRTMPGKSPDTSNGVAGRASLDLAILAVMWVLTSARLLLKGRRVAEDGGI